MEKELIEETTEIEEESEEVEENASETGSKEIEIDFSLDPVERIKLEIKNAKTPNDKAIGDYLLEQFAKDEVLKNCYKDRKITLEAVSKFVIECAKKHLNSKNGMIEDKIVFGWVLHYVQDEPVKIATTESYTLTKADKESAKEKALKQYQEEEFKKLQKEQQRKADAQKRKIEKELAKEKESGQMNLFEGF